jgi:predicted aspartyl protease
VSWKNVKTTALCLAAVLAIAALFGVTEGRSSQAEPEEKLEISWAVPNHKIAVIPFESPNNMILLQVSVNNSKPLWFVLDSGSSYCLIDQSQAKALGLQFESTAQGQGAGAGTYTVQVIRGAVHFRLAGLTAMVAPVGAMDLSSIEPDVGHKVDGILGYDIFEKLIVTADYVSRQCTFAAPEAFHPLEGARSFQLKFEDRVPLVHARITIPGNPPTDAEFLVDTGSGDAVDHPLIKKSTGKLLQTVTGVGLGQELSGVAGRIESLQLGPFELRGAVSACCGGSDLSSRLIGGQALSRFAVTLDYAHQELLLRPNRNYHRPFSADQSGLQLRLVSATGELAIHAVTKDSPAADAGLRSGDVILAVGKVRSSQIGLAKVRSMFEASSGKYNLKVRRGDETFGVTMQLRPLL